MAIKDINSNDVTISVFLKNEDYFLEKDMTSKPFGDNDKFVSFWSEGSLVIIPMTRVKEVHFNHPK